MQYVLTLTCDPGAPILAQAHANAARDAMSAWRATNIEATWLSAGRAVDLVFEAPAIDGAQAKVREALSGLAVDINAQPLAARRKPLRSRRRGRGEREPADWFP